MMPKGTVDMAAENHLDMPFPERLTAFRKAKGLTQQALADQIGSSKIQIYRYESGASQPTLDVLRKLALALSVSADDLVFEADERGPGDNLKMQFEEVSRFDAEDLQAARTLLGGLILQHHAKKLASLRELGRKREGPVQ
jgi:transcriptional regulator with XRE-family HTH domain